MGELEVRHQRATALTGETLNEAPGGLGIWVTRAVGIRRMGEACLTVLNLRDCEWAGLNSQSIRGRNNAQKQNQRCGSTIPRCSLAGGDHAIVLLPSCQPHVFTLPINFRDNHESPFAVA